MEINSTLRFVRSAFEYFVAAISGACLEGVKSSELGADFYLSFDAKTQVGNAVCWGANNTKILLA